MNKTAIKNFAIWARNKLIADISYRAGLMGITEKGIADALPQSTRDTQFFDIGTSQPYAIHGEEIRQRRKLVEVIHQKEADSNYKTAYQYIIEEVAYTWFNRLIAVRFMEVNDYLPSHIRVLSSESGKLEPDLVTNPFDAELEFKKAEESDLMEYRQNNQVDEAFRLLFRLQCNALHEFLPGLFETTADYTELLLNLSIIDQEGVVYHLVHDIPEDDFNIEKGGQVEIIGWLYQYYNTEPKDIAFKKEGKITKDEIPAITQLFTPDWIVRYMVENSLGRLWTEGHLDTAADLKRNWKYYLEEAEQEPKVQVKLAEIRKEYAQLSPEDLTFIDPCMGSGHIMVYAFDVLMQIYESAGYSQRDAAQNILKYNLYGLDIDDRAAQLAYFAVMMKARQYDGRIFKRGIQPCVFAIQESNNVRRNHLKYLGAGLSELEKNAARIQLEGLLDALTNAKEYGSILYIDTCNWTLLRKYVAGLNIPDQFTLDSYGVEETATQLNNLIDIAETMARKYWVSCTNPPYMSMSNADDRLLDYANSKYPDARTDLCSMFVMRNLGWIHTYGYMGMITMQGWMFLTTFEKLRIHMSSQANLDSELHLDSGAFDHDVGTVVKTVSFVYRKGLIAQYKGKAVDLREGSSSKEKEQLYLTNPVIRLFTQDTFECIPGNVFAYWVGPNAAKNYREKKSLSDFAQTRQGIKTGNNDLFLRLWFETDTDQISFSGDLKSSKWYPCNKGGDYRKWYGNNSYLVNWKNDGYEIRNYKNSKGKLLSRPQNTQYAFKKGLTWSSISSGMIAMRYSDGSAMFESKGSMCFPFNDDNIWQIQAYLNSKIGNYYVSALSPNFDFTEGAVEKVPFEPVLNDEVDNIAKENVGISKDDWDSYETSWNFKSHPLHRNASTIEESFSVWKEECTNRFNRLRDNEERLNRIFIDSYDVHEELSPIVEDKDITVKKADLQRDIRSLISYSVGCMFGRYSVDAEGLIYAGGNWGERFASYIGTVTSLKEQEATWRELKAQKVAWGKASRKFCYLKETGKSAFESFPVDYDNVIPITDEEYFDDDIVARFCDWVKYVYGADTLEENLDFIANALGNKGQTSRDVIRNYFLNDFYKDHCQTYSVIGSGKRPIYWLFDSGKQNAFKALIYLHRYTPDTIGNLRVDYLHRMQHVYESEIDRMQDMITHSMNSREVAAATKRKERLQKQLKECRDYDEMIGHLALSRIDLDLDDGVKVNYRKIQTAQDGKFYEVLADSKNIMAKDKLWHEYLTEWKH